MRKDFMKSRVPEHEIRDWADRINAKTDYPQPLNGCEVRLEVHLDQLNIENQGGIGPDFGRGSAFAIG